MVSSTSVLEPKRNPRNFPRKGLGSGPRIPSKLLNPGQRSREITKRLYVGGQRWRSCYPGPKENITKTCLSSIQRTPGPWCLSSAAAAAEHLGGRRKHRSTFTEPTWVTGQGCCPSRSEGRPGSLWAPVLSPPLLCPGYCLPLPTARLQLTNQGCFGSHFYQNRVPKEGKSTVPGPMPVPATHTAWDTYSFLGFDVCCWRKRKCSILPLHIWGALHGSSRPPFG